MEKHYEFNEEELTNRLDTIISKTGPFVRAVNIANQYLHQDGEEFDYPNAVRMLADVVELEESAKNETLVAVNSMLEEMSELHIKIEADLKRYQKLSTEWYTIKHDLDVIDTIQLRLNASLDIITGNIRKVDILKEELTQIMKYIGEDPLERKCSEILYVITDPSGEHVEKRYLLQGVI